MTPSGLCAEPFCSRGGAATIVQFSRRRWFALTPSSSAATLSGTHKFKTVPFALFRDTTLDQLTPNVLAFQLQPVEGVSLEFDAKKPGPEIEVGGVRMDFKYKDYFQTSPATGYETLIYDCMIGDPMLFQRADSVQAGWEVVQPIVDQWKNDKSSPLEFYPTGTAGPAAADELLARGGRAWRPLS